MSAAELISHQARSLLHAGDTESAAKLLSEAAHRGDPDALHELALWHVYGNPVPRNFAVARALFGKAGEAGHRASAMTYAVFVAMGAGGPTDWGTALALLDKAAANDPAAARQRELIAAMTLNADGTPVAVPPVEMWSNSPQTRVVRSLFKPAECAHVIGLSRPDMRPSIVVDSRTGREAPNPVRTSDGTVLGPIQQDLVVHALNLRIAAASGTRVRQGEPLSVLRYVPGQQYRLHHDCLPGEMNQREMTLIAYLNGDYEGGATEFPAAGFAFRGEVGDAILFTNILADGRVNEASRHAGLPVSSGEKWICTRWIRAHDFDPWRAYPA